MLHKDDSKISNFSITLWIVSVFTGGHNRRAATYLRPLHVVYLLFKNHSLTPRYINVTSDFWGRSRSQSGVSKLCKTTQTLRIAEVASIKSITFVQLCAWGLLNLVWTFFFFFFSPHRHAATLPLDGWDGWPRAWRSACRTVCEPTGLVFIWRLCHKRGGVGGTETEHRVAVQRKHTGSVEHTQTQACAINPHPHTHKLINFILQSSPRTIRIPWRNDFPIKGDLEEVGLFFFYLRFLEFFIPII